MSLELLVAKGHAMTKVATNSKDGIWAYKACKLSSDILDGVLECCPDPEWVTNDIIPLLKGIAEAVKKIHLKSPEPFADYTVGFAKNIEERICRLQKYVEDSVRYMEKNFSQEVGQKSQDNG